MSPYSMLGNVPFLRAAKFLSFFLIPIFFIVFSTAELQATTNAHISFADLCLQADIIFEATVVSAQSRYDQDLIYTDVSLSDIAMIKGPSLPQPFLLTFLGGIIDSDSQVFPGTPQFDTDERKIIFLEVVPSGYAIVGLWEGVFTKRQVIPGGLEAVERADGRFVEGFDQATGELQFYMPVSEYSKPAVYLDQGAFRALIDTLQAP